MFASKFKHFYQHVVQECKHYALSTKLLYRETAATFSMVREARRNQTPLTYRQKTQLQRTVKDWILAVPVLTGVIVPGAELLIVAAVKFDLLPTTFQKKEYQEERKKKMLAQKLEVSKFLTQMCSSGFSQIKDPALLPHVSTFEEILAKGRKERLSTEELKKVAPLFDSALTLSTLNRPQLEAVSKMLDVNVKFATMDMLRKRIDSKVRLLEKEDRKLHFYSRDDGLSIDGRETLNIRELKTLCRSRGLQASWDDPERLSRHLREWLDLRQTPVILRLLANAFRNEREDLTLSLQNTLGHIPEAAVKDAKAALLEHSGKEEDQIEADKLRLEIEQNADLEESERKEDRPEKSTNFSENTPGNETATETATATETELEEHAAQAQEIIARISILEKEIEDSLRSEHAIISEESLEQKKEELRELKALREVGLRVTDLCSQK